MDSGREYETHAESTHVYGTRMRVYMCHLPLALLQYPRKRNWVSSEYLVFWSFWILLSYSYIGRVTFCKRIQQSPSFQSILFPASIPLLHSSQSHGNTNNGHPEATNNIITITKAYQSNHYYRIYNWSSTTIGRTHMAWCHPCGRMRGAPCGKLCDFRPGS